MATNFAKQFHDLTDCWPLPWQERLFKDYFQTGDDLPQVIDLPTGLGKTMVMAIWLIARLTNGMLPRRLVYVVDRRTVVDQATDLAMKLQENAQKALGSKLVVSTLRGQLADNREWSRDPSQPAIIIGTVDLIGSALLFSGYRSTYKRRPLQAGLLGQDSLLVLDEAHLSSPFEKLLLSIVELQKDQGLPMRVIRMSATSAKGETGSAFRLIKDDTKPNSRNGKTEDDTAKRYLAKKRLTITRTPNLVGAIAAAANELAQSKTGKRIVIFVKTPKLVDEVHKALVKLEKDHSTNIALLTGTMRGLERDRLVDRDGPLKDEEHQRRAMLRFLQPEDKSPQAPCFLISTSAGEVGFDLNADHMVCDAAPLDSMIQRLGRVNRRGLGSASVRLVLEESPSEKSEMDRASNTAAALLSDGMDVSPKAMAKLVSVLSSEQIAAAISPRPATRDLTDILLDTWSLTSITERIPGRPEVAPWLRGESVELPQVSVAWRAEIDLLAGEPNSQSLLRAIFSAHRVRTHEVLTTKSSEVQEFLKKITREKGGRPDLKDKPVVVQRTHDLFVKSIGELIDDPAILNAEPTLLLPASLGGLAHGLLSADEVAVSAGDIERLVQPLDVADKHGYESREEIKPRCRILLERTEDGGWRPAPLAHVDSEGMPTTTLLDFDDEIKNRKKICAVLLNKHRLRTREAIAFAPDSEGVPQKLLLLLSGFSPKARYEDQLLGEHVGAVEREARRIASDLGLPKNDTFRKALEFAARWHDEGKTTPHWQRFINGSVDRPLGKSARYCDPRKLAGYRHEFGSLLRVLHPRDKTSELPSDEEVRELALHLIAVHHGHGRPHFSNAFDRDFHDQSLVDEVHIGCVRRFARLQRRYGWWRLAWLENLLRCADGIASEQVNNDENQDEDMEHDA